MEALFIYLLKAGLWVAIFGLFYKLFLQKETFYSFNRVYLLAGLVLSFLIPFYIYHYPVEWSLKIADESVVIVEKSPGSGSPQSIHWTVVVTCLYCLGIGYLVLKNIFALKKIRRFLRAKKSVWKETFYLIDSSDVQTPFSFFHYVAINTQGKRILILIFFKY